MRPGRKDERYHILIHGQELVVLQQYTWAMAEAYGLDRRIDQYKGTRPIGLWSWDLDCLEAVLDNALRDCQDSNSQEYRTLKSLKAKIDALLDQTHPNRGQ
jgi:hypothetical protein